jgi:hypothetical protein
MNAVKCPECGEGFDEAEFHWVTNAEGGVMYRLPCDHVVVGTWKGDVVTYGPEHAETGHAQIGHHQGHDHHHHLVDFHEHAMDYLDKVLDEKLHEK